MGKQVVQGVEFDLDPENLNDWDVLEGVAVIQDESASDAEKLVASVKVMRRVFGASFEQVKKQLREKHDGQLTAEVMSDFMTETFKAVNPN